MWVNRIVFFLLWVLSLVGISYFGGPISYGFFYVMTLLFLLCLIYLIIVRIRFSVYQNLDGRELVVNQVRPFLFSLQNETGMTFSAVRVNLFSDFSTISGQESGVDYELEPRSGIRNEAEIVCRYRGDYDVGVKSIQVQDFMRIFRFTYRCAEPVHVRVKPALIDLDELQSVDVQKLAAASVAGNPTEADVTVRKYEPGDDIRYIHWKASASTGELLVRKRIGEEQHGISVLFGTERYADRPMDYLPPENKVLETALAVALFFTKKNTPVTMEWLGKETLSEKTADRSENFEALYEAVSLCEFAPERTDKDFFSKAAASPALYRSRLVFVIIQKWSTEAMQFADLLNRHNVVSVFYIITEDPEISAASASLPRTELHTIHPEADLKGVM